jgi:hypothetical protein
LQGLVFTFDRPLRFFDSTKVHFSTDSTFTPYTAYTTALDSTKTVLTFQTAWQPGTIYNVLLEKDFAEDTLGQRLLKSDTLTFTAKGQADYGAVAIRVRNVDTTKNPVLQFVQSDAVVFSVPVKSGEFRQTLFLPGDYDLRLLYDRNNNGKWDPGQFFGTKIQPEIAQPIDRKITVKPGTGNDVEITL